MTKFNQGCTKYSAKCIQQFPYDSHTWRVAQDFPKVPFLPWNSPNTFQKINKILIGSEKPPHTSFFRFRKNPSFGGRLTLGLMIFLKQNSGFNGIIYEEFLLWIVISFFSFVPPNKIMCNFDWSWKTSWHVFYHFIKNPYFWWPPRFCHIKMSLQKSQN